MDNTLETIRASSDTSIPEEVSYLYGRDPSILAYGQRFISKESQKNLYSLYEEEESTDGDALSPTIKVYLRMKPFPRKMQLTKDQKEAYTIVNSTTLFTKMPSLEHNTSCLKRPKSSDTICKKFTFTQTFVPETTQSEIFEQAVQPQMVNFLAGQNSSVMTYGTTNSGKSYTLHGNSTAPGIIPRGLEYIFTNISPKATPCYKPINHSDVIALDGPERAVELEIKMNLLSFIDKSDHILAYQRMQSLLNEEASIRTSEATDSSYSVWVSFAEIYNETIFDLLSNDVQTRRPALKLSTDSQGRAFIKGLKTICVNSGSEAYQVLLAGQYNLKVAATALNARSSRSHCIFTVTLLKYDREECPESVDVSTFAFCDLAGSERLKKTLNAGDRLKEAQNINTSLLVLGRCLKSIYESQASKQKQNLVGPFRESKLTRLFQKALSGHENIALIVNVNPVPNLYVETQNVLNFSAIAKKIVIEPKKTVRKKSSRFSMLVTQSIKTVTDWDTMDLDHIEEIESESDDEGDMVHREDYDEILNDNIKLKREIVQLKNSSLERDMQIRQELADTYGEMIRKIEDDWRNRVKDVEEQQEDHLEYSLNRLEVFYKEKINRLNSRKRMRSDVEGDDPEDDDKKTCEELEDEIAYLTSKVKNMKETIRSLREQKEKEIVEKTTISFELSLVKEELKDVKNLLESANKDIKVEGDDNYIQELKAQLKAEQEKNKQLKMFLNEAKDDYISITTDGRHMEKKLKEKEELLIEFEDRLLEMENQVESTNLCLAEKVKIIENLEDKVDNQNKLIADLEEDMMNMKEKQRVQRDVMRAVKETQTTEELSSLEKNEEPRVEVRETSCQTRVPTFSDCDVQTEDIEIRNEDTELKKDTEIKKESNFFLEEKSLQTSLLDDSRLALAERLEEIEKESAQFEAERDDLKELLSKKNEEITKQIQKLEDTITKCHEDHEATKNEMQNQLGIAKRKYEFTTEALEDYKEKIEKMEMDLEKAADLQKKIKKMNVLLEQRESENQDLQSRMEEIEKKCKSLEVQLEKVAKDKEIEVVTLQKEIKELMHAKTSHEESLEKEAEKQIKATLKTLAATEFALSDEKEKNKKLQRQKERLEKDMMVCKTTIENLNVLEERDRQLQQENSNLKEDYKTIQNELQQKQAELEKFSKNRDDTVKRYENLVNTLQEDIDREKKEVTRLQDLFQRHATSTPKDEVHRLKLQLELAQDQLRTFEEEKENEKLTLTGKCRKTRQRKIKEVCDNTSEDEAPYSERRRRSPRSRKCSPAHSKEGSIIDVSSTESKRALRLKAEFPPPDILPVSSQRKRTANRRKKLFVPDNETCVDFEPCDAPNLAPTPSPLTALRSLRARKK